MARPLITTQTSTARPLLGETPKPTVSDTIWSQIGQGIRNIADIPKNVGLSIGNEMAGTVQRNVQEAGTTLTNQQQGVGNILSGSAGIFKNLTGALSAPVSSTWNQTIGKVANPVIESTLGAGADVIKGAFPEIAQSWDTVSKEHPQLAKTITDLLQSAGNVAMVAGAGNKIPTPTNVVEGGINIAKKVPSAVSKITPSILKKSETSLQKDTEAFDNLANTIVQGKKEDIATAQKALAQVDTSGVKTYDDLSHVFSSKIKNISQELDKRLENVPVYNKPLKISDLETRIKIGDETVLHNYVTDAIHQLKDLYIKTNNIEKLTKIKQLEQKGNADGLSVKELNDLARLHGQDLKAFNANGEAATGLSKQAAENTRVGLKTTARDISGDPLYKATDEELSNLIKTRDMVDNVSEKVNTLKQKVKERGLGEKIGRMVFKGIDIVSGGALKGFIQSFIPRSAGLKIMNALDLEKDLSKNLQKFDELLNKKNLTESQIKAEVDNIVQSSNAFLTNQPTNINPNITDSIEKSIPQNDIISKVAQSTIKGVKDFSKNPKGGLSLQDVTKDLTEQAKKYKSAEEFYKAQTDPLKEFKAGVGIKDPDIARGTVKEAINDIGGIDNVKRGNVDINKLETTEKINTSSERYKAIEAEVKSGKITPIIADENLSVMDGHHRLEVYRAMGMKDIPVIIPKETAGVKFQTKSQLTEIWNKAHGK